MKVGSGEGKEDIQGNHCEMMISLGATVLSNYKHD